MASGGDAELHDVVSSSVLRYSRAAHSGAFSRDGTLGIGVGGRLLLTTNDGIWHPVVARSRQGFPSFLPSQSPDTPVHPPRISRLIGNPFPPALLKQTSYVTDDRDVDVIGVCPRVESAHHRGPKTTRSRRVVDPAMLGVPAADEIEGCPAVDCVLLFHRSPQWFGRPRHHYASAAVVPRTLLVIINVAGSCASALQKGSVNLSVDHIRPGALLDDEHIRAPNGKDLLLRHVNAVNPVDETSPPAITRQCRSPLPAKVKH